MNSIKQLCLVITAMLLVLPIVGYPADKQTKETKSCKQVFAEWTTGDQLVAPKGCSILVEGSKGRPYCNGKPLTKDSCRPE